VKKPKGADGPHMRVRECIAFIMQRLSFREEILSLNENLPEHLRIKDGVVDRQALQRAIGRECQAIVSNAGSAFRVPCENPETFTLTFDISKMHQELQEKGPLFYLTNVEGPLDGSFHGVAQGSLEMKKRQAVLRAAAVLQVRSQDCNAAAQYVQCGENDWFLLLQFLMQ
jgi:hypothetical protein